MFPCLCCVYHFFSFAVDALVPCNMANKDLLKAIEELHREMKRNSCRSDNPLKEMLGRNFVTLRRARVFSLKQFEE